MKFHQAAYILTIRKILFLWQSIEEQSYQKYNSRIRRKRQRRQGRKKQIKKILTIVML